MKMQDSLNISKYLSCLLSNICIYGDAANISLDIYNKYNMNSKH